MGQSLKTERRTEQFNLSLTKGELEKIRKRAETVGMRPVHFGRALLFAEESRAVAKENTDDNGARLIYAQLIRLGNNLNQMVRHLHRTGDPLPPDLEPLLKDIRLIIARAPK
jgi:hypothetical protein